MPLLLQKVVDWVTEPTDPGIAIPYVDVDGQTLMGMDKALITGRWRVPADDDYIFYYAVNDDVKVYVDGDIVISDTSGSASSGTVNDLHFAAGYHDLRIEYTNTIGATVTDRSLKWWWHTTGTPVTTNPANPPDISWTEAYLSNQYGILDQIGMYRPLSRGKLPYSTHWITMLDGRMVEVTQFAPNPSTSRVDYYYNSRTNQLYKRMWSIRQPEHGRYSAYWQSVTR